MFYLTLCLNICASLSLLNVHVTQKCFFIHTFTKLLFLFVSSVSLALSVSSSPLSSSPLSSLLSSLCSHILFSVPSFLLCLFWFKTRCACFFRTPQTSKSNCCSLETISISIFNARILRFAGATKICRKNDPFGEDGRKGFCQLGLICFEAECFLEVCLIRCMFGYWEV